MKVITASVWWNGFVKAYFHVAGQIPYLCDRMDEGLITREFEFFKIPLIPQEFEMENNQHSEKELIR